MDTTQTKNLILKGMTRTLKWQKIECNAKSKTLFSYPPVCHCKTLYQPFWLSKCIRKNTGIQHADVC